jgi:hypothetical protein
MRLVAISAATTATVTAASATVTATAPATVTAATVAAATAATTTTTEATRPRLARTSLVHRQGTPAVLLAVEGRDRSLGFFVAGHLDETESLASPGRPVSDHFRALDRSVLRQHFLQIRTADIIAEVPDIQLLAHRSSPVDGNYPTPFFAFMGRF